MDLDLPYRTDYAFNAGECNKCQKTFLHGELRIAEMVQVKNNFTEIVFSMVKLIFINLANSQNVKTLGNHIGTTFIASLSFIIPNQRMSLRILRTLKVPIN